MQQMAANEKSGSKGRLAERTQVSGANAPSPPKQFLPQRRRNAQEEILESAGVLTRCTATPHEFIWPICEYVGLTSFRSHEENLLW
jgi:hypothetical protein